MKKLILILLFTTTMFAEMTFNKGVNLTQWFEVGNVKKINFTKYTKQDFEDIKSLGCDVIRLPIRINDFSNGAPNYTLDPLFFFFLDQVVDWAEEVDINLILDNHTFSASTPTDSLTTNPLISVWSQMAEHYESRSNLIFYEVLNEPHDIDGNLWYEIQGSVVKTIREYDTKHTIIVGGHSWNTYNTLNEIPDYGDDNLIYTFHFYDPFIFTHQGANWGGPPLLENLGNIPFPYADGQMPVLPTEFVGTWIESEFNNYDSEGTIDEVKNLLDIAVDFHDSTNIPLFCGEFGVLRSNVKNEDRVFWYNVVTEYLNENNISWTTWDYNGAFGLFKGGTSELFNYDLNIPLLEAVGFNIPQQWEYQIIPDTAGFDIYTDYVGEKMGFDHWDFEVENLDYYHDVNPQSGMRCIKFQNSQQYAKILLNFIPNKDLSTLLESGYQLEFYVKSSHDDVQFDVRFIDSVTDVPEDRPWRMGRKINNTVTEWNGEWQKVQIPLSEMIELGSWYNNTWQGPKGLFDWTDINFFEFALEDSNLIGKEVYFDEIKIVKSPSVLIADFSSDITSGTPPLAVQFTDNSSGEIESWNWDFGDGGTSSDPNPLHIYNSSGIYSVSLIIQNSMDADTLIKNNLITVTDSIDNNMLINGSFENDLNDWSTYIHTNATAAASVNNETFMMDITNGGNENWNVQLIQSNINIENGQKYSVSLDAYSEQSRSISVDVSQDGGAYTQYGNAQFNLSPNMENYTFDFTMNNSTDQNARFVVSMGNSIHNVYLDNIRLTKYIPEPGVTLTAPNGGEILRSGKSKRITWQKHDIENVLLHFSKDNGVSWAQITQSTFSGSNYNWTIPEISSAQCLIKISSSIDSSVNDVSDSPFTIKNPVITITSPEANEVWEQGTTQQINWTSSDVDKVDIKYTIQNDWIDISSEINASDKNYSWLVPNTPSSNCKIKILDSSDNTVFSESDVFEIQGEVSIDEKSIPLDFALMQNHPNPFNPVTVIKYSVPKTSEISLIVYNILGDEVATLVNETQNIGHYTIMFNGSQYPSGLYFVFMKSKSFQKIIKMALIK